MSLNELAIACVICSNVRPVWFYCKLPRQVLIGRLEAAFLAIFGCSSGLNLVDSYQVDISGI